MELEDTLVCLHVLLVVGEQLSLILLLDLVHQLVLCQLHFFLFKQVLFGNELEVYLVELLFYLDDLRFVVARTSIPKPGVMLELRDA